MFKKLKEFSSKYFEVALVLGYLVALTLFWLIVEFIHKFPFFNQFETDEFVSTITTIFLIVSILFYICYSYHKLRKYNETARKLKERKLSDYLEKYQYYVNLVCEISSRKEYNSITLEEDWCKLFDTSLIELATFYQSNVYFDDFDVAACLLYTLYEKGNGGNLSAFLFDCISPIISEPKIYDIKFILSGELILEEQEESYKRTDLSIPSPDLSKDTVILLIETYLSITSCAHSLSKLSNFLNILYVKSCKD